MLSNIYCFVRRQNHPFTEVCQNGTMQDERTTFLDHLTHNECSLALPQLKLHTGRQLEKPFDLI